MAAANPNPVLKAMEHTLGPEHVTDDAIGYSISGLQPHAVVFPKGIRELSDALTATWEDSLAVAPWGGGTRTELGNPLRRLDVVVDMSHLNGVVEHNPSDLTLTVEAGITLGALQRILVEHGQFLALDPPLPDRATIGGTLATGVSGPTKWQYGNPRDLVIGMKVVQADGKVVKSGGRVVKNVSGYDMARLHIGGLGSLGIIAEASFKLTPLPRNETTLVAAFGSGRRCLETGLSIFHSDVTPLVLTSFDRCANEQGEVVSLDGDHFLAIRLGGRPLTLQRQVRECLSLCHLGGAATVETLDEATALSLWRRVADFGWDGRTLPAMAGRTSTPPAKIPDLATALERSGDSEGLRPAIISHHGYGTTLIHWFADGDNGSTETVSNVLSDARDAVHAMGGRMVIERCPSAVKPRFDVWDEMGESLAIMRRMKEQYDPKGVLNPGRFVGGI